jgi:hypothetical protein
VKINSHSDNEKHQQITQFRARARIMDELKSKNKELQRKIQSLTIINIPIHQDNVKQLQDVIIENNNIITNIIN